MPRQPVRFAILSLGLPFAAALAVAGPAFGDSSTVAEEPAVVPGQQEFGNSTGDAPVDDVWVASYWGLPVVAGDRVTIAVEGSPTQRGSFELFAEPVGTGDGLGIDSLSEDAVGRCGLNKENRGRSRFIAPKTGVMPLAFTMGGIEAGAYNFTVSEEHKVDMQLPRSRRIKPRGRLRVAAHDPDGRPLTVPQLTIGVQMQVSKHHWKTIGRAAPSQGIAHVHYVVPGRWRHRAVRLRARASGGGYFAQHTASRRIRVD